MQHKKKVIIFKDSKEVSPLKEPHPSSHPLPPPPETFKVSLPPLPKTNHTLNNDQCNEILGNAGPLITLEMIKCIVEQEEVDLKERFYPKCIPVVKEAFDLTIEHFLNSLREIKEERVERVSMLLYR